MLFTIFMHRIGLALIDSTTFILSSENQDIWLAKIYDLEIKGHINNLRFTAWNFRFVRTIHNIGIVSWVHIYIWNEIVWFDSVKRLATSIAHVSLVRGYQYRKDNRCLSWNNCGVYKALHRLDQLIEQILIGRNDLIFHTK